MNECDVFYTTEFTKFLRTLDERHENNLKRPKNSLLWKKGEYFVQKLKDSYHPMHSQASKLVIQLIFATHNCDIVFIFSADSK